MKTTEKARIGIAKTIADLTVKGYQISVPLSEHSHFDLIVSKKGVHRTIQVRYCTLRKNGVIGTQFKTSWSNTKGCHANPMDKNIIDIVCIYCPDNDTCYYVNPRKFGGSVILRIIASKGKGNQISRFNLAKDFLKFEEG